MTAKITRGPKRRNARHKGVNIALQGGGAHGAFTWGVLDKLFEDDRIWIEALSGTSAGAMNAVVAAQGMYEGGAEGARTALHDFWRAVSDAAAGSPLQRTVAGQIMGDWSLKHSPSFLWFDMLTRVASPYQLNPFDYNPLRKLVEEHVDFRKVRGCGDMQVFLSATNVETGHARIFNRDELDVDVVLASACLPTMHHTIEIEGQPYWDGGFMGNPPLYPFFKGSPSNDILIVQINPVFRPGVPKTAADIQNRLNEITFNSSLLHELRAISFVTKLLDEGTLEEGGDYQRMFLHVIQSRKRMRDLDATSKLNPEWKFLRHLFEIGRDTATNWLEAHFDDLGERSSVDVRSMFESNGTSPKAPSGG